MRLRTALIVIGVCSVLACSRKESQPDFRNTNWGMNREQVKLVEDSRLVLDGARMLSYDGTVGGDPCQVVYLFVRDQLVGAHYLFKADHAHNNSYIDDYRNLKETVARKYGRPVLDETTWKNDQYRNDADRIGLAVELGHVALATQWTTPSTDIWLFLVGENAKIKLSMRYSSRKLAGLRDEETAADSGQTTRNPDEF